MKKTIFAMLFIATICTLFSSCKDDETKWDKNAKLYIKGVDRANKSLSEAMTVAEICSLDTVLMYLPQYGAFSPFGDEFDNKIDRVNNRLVMVVGNIETFDDNQFFISPEVIIGKISNNDYNSFDTLGYVPYSQRYAAAIKTLWEGEDWDAIYNIFQNAFTFIPCTGAEYKAMIENGEE